MAKDTAELPRRISEVSKIATSGRLGLIFVDLPKDIAASVLRTPPPIQSYGSRSAVGSPQKSLTIQGQSFSRYVRDKTSHRYDQQGTKTNHLPSCFPLSVLPSSPSSRGRQHSHHYDSQGLGAFDETSEQSPNMFSMHSSGYANLVMQKTDHRLWDLIGWPCDG